MSYRLEYIADSFKGLVRAINEDNLWCAGTSLERIHEDLDEPITGTINSDEYPAFVVFDGIGGAPDGEVASYLAARTYGRLADDLSIEEKVDRMEYSICRYAREKKIHTMGTTAAGLVFEDSKVSAYNLGDSRSYVARGGRLKQLSVDDVAFSDFFFRNAITQYVGPPRKKKQGNIHLLSKPLHAGDIYLVCSDGLSGMVEPGKMRQIICGNGTLAEKHAALKESILEKGARDNATYILIEVNEQ